MPDSLPDAIRKLEPPKWILESEAATWRSGADTAAALAQERLGENYLGEVESDLRKTRKEITALRAQLAAANEQRKEESRLYIHAISTISELRARLLTAAGDDLCRLTQEEINAYADGSVKIPPEEEFLASCKRFHNQHASEHGVLSGCLTLAQLIAENEKQRQQLAAAEERAGKGEQHELKVHREQVKAIDAVLDSAGVARFKEQRVEINSADMPMDGGQTCEELALLERISQLAAHERGGVQGGIYVASRASVPARGQMWRRYRDKGVPIISTWIDEDGEGQSPCLRDLWQRIEREVASAERLILYAEPDDFPLKGALIEVGMALSAGVPVTVVAPGVQLETRSMRPIGSWAKHPLVSFAETVDAALGLSLDAQAEGGGE